jgi:hypothetical protein
LLLSVCLSDLSSERGVVILYPVSSHSPKSISLHLSEQNGKYFATSEAALKCFLQVGHLCLILSGLDFAIFVLKINNALAFFKDLTALFFSFTALLLRILFRAFRRIPRCISPRAGLSVLIWVLVYSDPRRYRKFPLQYA